MTERPSEPTVLWPTEEQVSAEFQAYTSAVGKVAHAWNYLHERLGALFALIVNAPERDVIAAVWYSTFSDRSQRQMLEAAILNWAEYHWQSHPAHAKKDLIWLLRRADELGNRRDDAIHAPAILNTDIQGTEMAASPLSGHRRAQRLRGKRLLIEFDWLERYIEELSRFSMAATNALAYADYRWPDKPRPPARRPRKALLTPPVPPKITVN
jgi:hypothetical protein